MDDFVSQFLNHPDTEEAKSWLEGATGEEFRTLGEHDSTEASMAIVDQFYAAGAVTVLAVEIDREDENTGKLVIELPSDSARRESVLAIASQIAESQGFDAEPDTGQKYVFVMLD